LGLRVLPLSGLEPSRRCIDLDSNYVDSAEVDVRLQLSRAGIRLAHMLNTSLGTERDDWSACLHAGR
jgi:hypothetical protein